MGFLTIQQKTKTAAISSYILFFKATAGRGHRKRRPNRRQPVLRTLERPATARGRQSPLLHLKNLGNKTQRQMYTAYIAGLIGSSDHKSI